MSLETLSQRLKQHNVSREAWLAVKCGFVNVFVEKLYLETALSKEACIEAEELIDKLSNELLPEVIATVRDLCSKEAMQHD